LKILRSKSVVVCLLFMGVGLCIHAMRGEARRPFPNERTLQGESAIQQLKAEGSYASLAAAIASVREPSVDGLQAQEGRLKPEDAGDGDWFGSAVALDGDTAVIGAPIDDATYSNQGSAYVFVRDETGWSQQQKLFASDPVTLDRFGSSVAIAGDTVVVGAPGAGLNQGAVYVFTRSGKVWMEQPKLLSEDGQNGDYFGFSVAISGDLVAVGAYRDMVGENENQGSVYVFARGEDGWKQQQRLIATNGAKDDLFGSSVAVNGDAVLAGAPEHDIGASWNQGAAYVFVNNGATWTEQGLLLGGDGAPGDLFGSSVALSGNTAAIGAKMNDFGLNSLDQGSVYIFTREGRNWIPQQQLWAADGGELDQFGQSLALDGDRLVVGASEDDLGPNQDQGSAYLFVRKGTEWLQQRRLLAEDGSSEDRFGVSVVLSGDAALVGANQASYKLKREGSAYVMAIREKDRIPEPLLTVKDGKAGDLFGSSIALSGEVLAVSAPYHNGAAGKQGAVYIFTRKGDQWVLQQTLTAINAAAYDRFGSSIALHGDRLVVGAYGYNMGQGAAYLFTRNGAVWSEEARLTDKEGIRGDLFGVSVAIHHDTVVVGAPLDAIGANQQQGSASIFLRSGSGWSQLKKLISDDGGPGEFFGYSVAISGATLAVGAPRDSMGLNLTQGSTYVFIHGAGGWIQEKKLIDSDGAGNDYFGHSVTVSGDTIAVGSPYAQVGGNQNQGAAILFNRIGGVWIVRQRLAARDGLDLSSFGTTLALNGDTLAVGAPYSGPRQEQRLVYIFTRRGAVWTERQIVRVSDGSTEDAVELPLALSGDALAVGGLYYDVGDNVDQGAAFLFTTPACLPVTFDPIVLPGARMNSPYAEKMTASGDQGAYQLSVTDGALPPGLSLDPRGALLGTPTVPGEYRFTISALNLNSLCAGGRTYTLKVSAPSDLGVATCVSAASFRGPLVAGESIVAVFGKDFSDAVETAQTQPLPTRLARTTVLVRDRNGVETLAPLFFVSPNQINLLTPTGMATGAAQIRVLHLDIPVAEGEIMIEAAAPALFSADSSGHGLAVGAAVYVKPDGSLSYEPIVAIDPQSKRLVAAPIDLDSANDRIFLTLFGTGLRNHSSLEGVSVKIDGLPAAALYAGPQGTFSGLDQLNVRLPRLLAGRGEVDVVLMVDGKQANTLKIAIK
jgi:uncharacterized protein (TIGR03437 family)